MGQTIDKLLAFKRLEVLVKRFKNNLKNGDISGSHKKTLDHFPSTEVGKRYSESQIRQGFILPMFRDVLGWDIDNSINEVIPELHNHLGFADFVFLRNNHRKFVLETKKPFVNVDPNSPSGRESLRQAIGYARSLKDVNLAVVSNFEILVFSHSFIMPQKGEEIKNVLDWFHFSEFLSEEKFEVLWQFRFEVCNDNNFCSDLLSKVNSKMVKKHKTIDQILLDDLKIIRVKLANSISGKSFSQDEADQLTQYLINRIIFIRALEDRNIIREKIAELIGQANIWERFKKHVTRIFNNFPIELLNIKNGNLLDDKRFRFEDVAFSEVLQMFYDRGADFYHDCYDFKYIPSDILGYAYEHNIAFRLISDSGTFKLEKKDFYKDGVHYTPAYICQNLSRKTIQRSAKDKKVDSVKELICADIACGSGSFLTSIYDCLYSLRYKELADKINDFVDCDNMKVLSLKDRKDFLEHSIFGIDIDPFAVEVSRLCLYLKFFESFPTGKTRLLKGEVPNIEKNIVFGDSLIDTSMKNKFSTECFPINSSKGKILNLIKNKKVDVIVGNPPYIKIQDLKKINMFPVDLYKKIYKESLGKGQIEFATAFVERATNIISDTGNVGFILPNKIFKNKQGKGVRNLVIGKSNFLVSEFVDFNSVQIFEASIYTCLLHLRNKQNKSVDFKCSQVYRMEDGAFLLSEIEKIQNKYPSNDFEIGSLAISSLGSGPWNLLVGIKRKIREKLLLKFPPFEKVIPESKIFQGVPTGADKIFLMEKISEKNEKIWEMSSESLKIIQKAIESTKEKKKYIEPTIEIEKKYLLPVYLGSTDLKLFSKEFSNFYLLYPYKKDGSLIKSNLFFSSNAYKYLSIPEHKNGLRNSKDKTLLQGLEEREEGKFAGKYFYQFSRPQNLKVWVEEKIMFPYMVEHFNAHLDTNHIFVNVSTGGYAIVPPKEEFKKYFLLALMNSEIFNFLVKSSSGDFRGGWFECSKQYVSEIPVPDANLDKDNINDMKSTIDSLYEINKRLNDNGLSNKERLNKLMQLNTNLDWLNSFVAGKYELTDDEIIIIEFYSAGETDIAFQGRVKEMSKLVEKLVKRLSEEIYHLSA